MNIVRIGLDLAKNVFMVCRVDEHGQVELKGPGSDIFKCKEVTLKGSIPLSGRPSA